MVQSEGEAINASRQRVHTCVAAMSSLEEERYAGINVRTSGGKRSTPVRVFVNVFAVEMTRRASDVMTLSYEERGISAMPGGKEYRREHTYPIKIRAQPTRCHLLCKFDSESTDQLLDGQSKIWVFLLLGTHGRGERHSERGEISRIHSLGI